MSSEFTGRHMLAVMVLGFGIVVAVNFFMASVAARSFSGVVVENSYVASQKFNGWLAENQQQKALGWKATISQANDGRLIATASGIPESARVVAEIRRPLGVRETATVELVHEAPGRFASAQPLADGRWIVRLSISAQGNTWRMEDQLP